MPAGVFFYPFRLAALASSPKGAPFGNAGKFAITAQSRPLGEGGCERSEQTEGVPRQAALTEGVPQNHMKKYTQIA